MSQLAFLPVIPLPECVNCGSTRETVNRDAELMADINGVELSAVDIVCCRPEKIRCSN